MDGNGWELRVPGQNGIMIFRPCFRNIRKLLEQKQRINFRKLSSNNFQLENLYGE